MRRKSITILAVILMVLTTAATNTVSANQSKGDTKPAAAQAAKPQQPKVAEPNPGWQDEYPDYYKVRMASATDGWIVGAEGAIRRYAGGQWVAYASPVTTTLHSVYPISNTAFAVGDNSVILQFIGDAWQTTSAPSGCTNFRDVWMVSPSDGWAVGGTCDITPTGVIAHYNGTSWMDVSVPYPLPQMNALQMLSANEGWFVGSDGALLHYLNGSWQAYNPGAAVNLYSIFMLPGGNEGWAGGDPFDFRGGATTHFANGSWNPNTSSPVDSAQDKQQPQGGTYYEQTVYAIAAKDDSTRWIVGSLHLSGPFGATNSNSGLAAPGGPIYPGGNNGPNDWQLADPNSMTYDANPLYGIAMVSANDVWAVGANGYIKHWNGSLWNVLAGAPHTFNSLAYNSIRAEIYSLGNTSVTYVSAYSVTSQIAASNLAANTVFSCTTAGPWWRSIASTSTTQLDAWAVGLGSNTDYSYGGYAAHITSSGCQITRIGNDNLSSVVEVSPTLVLAAGDAGTLAVYTGTWTSLTLGNQALTALGYDGGRYWAVGISGTIYTNAGDPINPSSWISITVQPSDDLYAVAGVSNNEAWAVGNGVRYHIIGNTATRQDSPHSLRAVYMSSPTDGWATGRDGAIEHYDGSSWQTVVQGLPPLDSIIATADGQVWAGGNGLDTYNVPFSGIFNYYYYIPGHLLHFAPACYDYYTDVPASYYARQYILDLSCRGIVSGKGNHIYAPDANTTRIQFAKIISLARGWTIITPPTPTFSDVPTSNPLYSFVETAYANHALSGASPADCQARGLANPCFLPNDPITRAQAVIITVRAFGWAIDTTGGPHFSDVPVGSYAYEAVETAYNRGVVNGIGNGTFGPGFNVARAQTAKIVDLAILSPLASLPDAKSR